MQINHVSTGRPDLVASCDDAVSAMRTLVDSSTPTGHERVKAVATRFAMLYAPYEGDPDSREARAVWQDLGAIWCAVETAAQDFDLESYDGLGPREASTTWCRRNTVWPIRAAEAAAAFSRHQEVRAVIRATLLDWFCSDSPNST